MDISISELYASTVLDWTRLKQDEETSSTGEEFGSAMSAAVNTQENVASPPTASSGGGGLPLSSDDEESLNIEQRIAERQTLMALLQKRSDERRWQVQLAQEEPDQTNQLTGR